MKRDQAAQGCQKETSGQAAEAGEPSAVPEHPEPPQRHQQDTQAVEGEHALNPPEEDDLTQRSKIQG
jgi:hypothetical protein